MNDADAPVDLTLLHTFYEVARLGSVTGAARALHRSQPAISHRLRALEDDLGVTLFEKVGARLRLTEHGRRLRAECVDLIAQSRALRRSVRQSKEEVAGRVVIGTLPTVASHLLVPAIADFLRRFPGAHLTFVFDYVEALWELLRTGQVDLVVTVGQRLDPALEAEVIAHTGLVATGAPAVFADLPDPAPAEALATHRYLAWEGPSDETFDAVRRWAEGHGLAGEATPRIPHTETLRELAAAGAGYTVLPAYTVRRDEEAGRLVTRRLRDLPGEVPIHLVGRVGQVTTPAVREVRELLRALG